MAVEREEVSALTDRADYVRDGRTSSRIDRLDPMKRVVVRWAEKVRHSRVADDELLAAASLSIEYARQQDTGVANEEAAWLKNDLQPRATHERADDFTEVTNIHGTLDVVGDGESTADIEILEPNFGVALDLPTQV